MKTAGETSTKAQQMRHYIDKVATDHTDAKHNMEARLVCSGGGKRRDKPFQIAVIPFEKRLLVNVTVKEKCTATPGRIC
jgi:hypothetical protein